jgi:hypothetical protein
MTPTALPSFVLLCPPLSSSEVFNGSEEDPGSWPAVITNLLVGGGYEVSYVLSVKYITLSSKVKRLRCRKGIFFEHLKQATTSPKRQWSQS